MLRRSCWLLCFISAFPIAAHAQAWLPDKGDFSAAVLYSDVYDTKHYLPDGDEIDVGHMSSRSIGLAAAYSPSDRMMIVAGLPYVSGAYHGERPHPGEVDNGDYHSTFTDLRVEFHYQVSLEPLAFAPYVALVQPTHDYPSLGHAAPGRNLQERWIGFFVGKNLDLWIPRTYVQARYNFAFVEKVADVGHDRSNYDLEIGYFVNPRVSLRALLFGQETHGGIDVPIPQSNPLFPYHDQLAAESFLNVGTGASYELSPDAESVCALRDVHQGYQRPQARPEHYFRRLVLSHLRLTSPEAGFQISSGNLPATFRLPGIFLATVSLAASAATNRNQTITGRSP